MASDKVYVGEEGAKALYTRVKGLISGVAGDVSAIEAVIPESAAADNQLVTESDLGEFGYEPAEADAHGQPDVQNPSTHKIYLVEVPESPEPDQCTEWVWVESTQTWKCIGSTSVDLSGYYTKGETDGLLGGKVDKVTGKGLSTNDYTDADQQKLGGIAAGAQVNVIETVKVNGAALTPVEKAVDITVPAAANDGTLTLKQNNVQVGTFSANQAGDTIINVTDTTYESKAESQGGNAVSLVTTGEKYSWNHVLPSGRTDGSLLTGVSNSLAWVTDQYEVNFIVHEPDPVYPTEIIAGKAYRVATINNITWMAQNLDYEYTNAKSHQDYPIFGKYYTHSMASSIASSIDGWHLPTRSEVKALYLALGLVVYESGDSIYWDYHNQTEEAGNAALNSALAEGYDEWPFATNTTGLSVVPSAYWYGGWQSFPKQTWYWCANTNAVMTMDGNTTAYGSPDASYSVSSAHADYYCPVRLVKDAT